MELYVKYTCDKHIYRHLYIYSCVKFNLNYNYFHIGARIITVDVNTYSLNDMFVSLFFRFNFPDSKKRFYDQ